MIIPDSPRVMEAGARAAYEWLERTEATANPAYRAKRWDDLSQEAKDLLMRALRPMAEYAAIAILHDARAALSSYDGCQGGAYERAFIRYCIDEIRYDPATGQSLKG